MGTSTWIIASVFLLSLTQARAQYVNTTCEEFEKNARFDPFEIVDSKWKIIYFWSPTVEPRPVIFSLLARKVLIFTLLFIFAIVSIFKSLIIFKN